MKASVAVRAIARAPASRVDRVPDPYKRRRKFPESTICPGCGAVFHKGRWQWLPHPLGAHSDACQACLRAKDSFPAGLLTLSGDFFQAHKESILRLARNVEHRERQDHPLHRIMSVDESAAAATIKTTDIHLPRRIGEALRRAYDGALSLKFDRGSYFVRGTWSR